VVEDEVSFREAVADFLEGQGCEVKQAASGPQALHIINEWEPDVALMDLRLPGMDGVEAAQQVRERSPNVRIIILTAHDDSVVRDSVLYEGAYGFLVKGCEPSLIAEMVREAARARKGWSA
jgi:CheY-like chemotaxis protein